MSCGPFRGAGRGGAERRRTRLWRRGRDSNPRYGCPYAAFRVRCFQPLSHLSAGRQVDKAMDERRDSYLAAGGGGNKRQAKDQPHSSSKASCSRPCERASPAPGYARRSGTAFYSRPWQRSPRIGDCDRRPDASKLGSRPPRGARSSIVAQGTLYQLPGIMGR